MLRIRTDQDEHSTVFRLAGDLTGLEVTKLERCWHQAAQNGSGSLCLDLRGVHNIDDSGKQLLERLFEGGAELLVAPHAPHSVKASVANTGCDSSQRPSLP